MSQALFAVTFGWSPQQLKRIEAGEVAPRFAPVWGMCSLLDINPLWVAFGDEYYRYGWVDFDVSSKSPGDPRHMLFIHVLQAIRAEYRARHKELIRQPKNYRREVFRTRLRELTDRAEQTLAVRDWASFIVYLNTAVKRFVERHAGAAKPIDRTNKLQNKWSSMGKRRARTWENLRQLVRARTSQRGSRAALAKMLGVTPQALNEWLQGRSAPPAQQTVQLLNWVEETEPAQKGAPEVRQHGPAPRKTRGRKSKT